MKPGGSGAQPGHASGMPKITSELASKGFFRHAAARQVFGGHQTNVNPTKFQGDLREIR